MSETTIATAIPGYIAGKWSIDPVHSEVSFTVRHMMVSKVRGHFNTFEAEIVTADNPADSKVTAKVDLSSISTKNEQRDAHLRSADYFEVDKFPFMTYTSTTIVPKGDPLGSEGKFVLEGELNLHGVTKAVTFELEVNGFTNDPYGGTRAGFSAKGEISRKDFGIDLEMPMDGGGVVVGDKITINLEIEAVLNQ